jgi:hypothetical protein
MRLPNAGVTAEGPEGYYLPWVKLGKTTYQFTTDSRFNTPWWLPGEIVVERFELPVRWEASAGVAPLQVGIREVSQGEELMLRSGDEGEGRSLVALTDVSLVLSRDGRAPLSRRLQRAKDRALGNLRGEILLRGARVNGRWVGSARARHKDEPIMVSPGDELRVVLEWESLRPIDDNYKVFVQLLDAGLQVRAQGDDKAPLGGSSPTWLWFPRWRRGTHISDTYLLRVPPDLPPGSYPLVAGMYGFSTFKRVQVVAPDGDMEGDWVTLAHIEVR